MITLKGGSAIYEGTSGDSKPTAGIDVNTLYHELDTNKWYYFKTDSTWGEVPNTGGGGSGFTPTTEQLAAMNSGITTEDVAQIGTNENNILLIENMMIFTTVNLFDTSLQTPDTISPHYYVNGYPYSTTEFDNQYNCTAMFEIEPNTQYTVGLVPPVKYGTTNIIKPWDAASQGIFFYTSDNTYISQSINNTFTTPQNAKYARFNYRINRNITLSVLNAQCMLVKGSTLPSNYVPYKHNILKDEISDIEANMPIAKIRYIINNDVVSLISKYDSFNDMVVTLQKKGGNNLFDIKQIGIIPNVQKELSTTLDNVTDIINSADDWFSPFIIGAVNNIDGDDTSNQTFTGGNHQYNNQGSGSTATARTTIIHFYADNQEVANGTGNCDKFEMVWTNLVQGYNTKKSDGTGREIIQENHRLIFDGQKFEAFVSLIPLEDVHIVKWYGLQWKANAAYNNVRYLDGTNRDLVSVSSAASESGNNTCSYVSSYGTTHEMLISIDKTYDLGSRIMYSTGTQGAFTQTYGKGYFFIISERDLGSMKQYNLHGFYQFMPRKEANAVPNT